MSITSAAKQARIETIAITCHMIEELKALQKKIQERIDLHTKEAEYDQLGILRLTKNHRIKYTKANGLVAWGKVNHVRWRAQMVELETGKVIDFENILECKGYTPVKLEDQFKLKKDIQLPEALMKSLRSDPNSPNKSQPAEQAEGAS